MRTLLSFCLVLALFPAGTAAAAPPDDQPQTLIGGPVSHGAFGGPSVAYTRLNGEDALLVGGRGGWLLNHRFVLGGGGWGLTNRVSVPAGSTAADRDHQLTFGYGGVWLEYIVAPSRLVHGSIGTLIGAGGLTYHRFRGHGNGGSGASNNAIFVLEPTASVELNVTPFVRLAVSGSYRGVAGVNLAGLSNRDVRGFAAGTMLKFGMF